LHKKLRKGASSYNILRISISRFKRVLFRKAKVLDCALLRHSKYFFYAYIFGIDG